MCVDHLLTIYRQCLGQHGANRIINSSSSNRSLGSQGHLRLANQTRSDRAEVSLFAVFSPYTRFPQTRRSLQGTARRCGILTQWSSLLMAAFGSSTFGQNSQQPAQPVNPMFGGATTNTATPGTTGTTGFGMCLIVRILH